MPKWSINATELVNTDVNFVALVKRGANRIPFRITKSEDNEMIDFHKIGRQLFKSDVQPTVVAAIVEKSADVPRVIATLKTVGIDVSAFAKSEKNGIVTLVQKADLPHPDVAFVKMSGGVALAVSNLSKAFDQNDFQSPDFGEVHAKGTHMASMANSVDSLHRTMGNIMQNAKDPKDAAKQMGDACDAHKAHVAKLTRALPEQAFKADQALLKAEVELIKAGGKSPHAGVALAIAHAAHQSALTAGRAADMLQGGADDDQQTGDGLGDEANDGKKVAMKSSDGQTLEDEGDPGAADPEMPPKDAAKKADAGQNGAGAGFELGAGTGTDDRATADDKENTEVDAKPGAQVSGDSSGLNPKLKAPTQKSAILAAKIAVAKAELALLLLKGEAEQMDDDSTSGAQSAVPAKAKVPTKKDEIKGLPDPQGESHAGEGAAQALDTRDVVSDEDVTGAAITGKVKGKTLDTSGLDAKLIAPTTKADGNTDGDIGKKGKGNELDESMSGAGAQEANVQTMKAENAAVMGAIQALAKSVKDSIASVTKTVGDLSGRLETVATLAKKNDAALHGTVLGEAGDDAAAWTQKSERDSAPPLLDTAFSRRRA